MLRHARRGVHPLRRSRPEWRVWSRWYLRRRLLARIALQGTASSHSILLDCNRGHGSHRRHCPCRYIQGRLSTAYGSLRHPLKTIAWAVAAGLSQHSLAFHNKGKHLVCGYIAVLV